MYDKVSHTRQLILAPLIFGGVKISTEYGCLYTLSLYLKIVHLNASYPESTHDAYLLLNSGLPDCVSLAGFGCLGTRASYWNPGCWQLSSNSRNLMTQKTRVLVERCMSGRDIIIQNVTRVLKITICYFKHQVSKQETFNNNYALYICIRFCKLPS